MTMPANQVHWVQGECEVLVLSMLSITLALLLTPFNFALPCFYLLFQKMVPQLWKSSKKRHEKEVKSAKRLVTGLGQVYSTCKGNWKLDLAKLAGGPKINIL